MTAGVTAILGPAGSGKTEYALSAYRQALAEAVPGSTLWLAPNWRAASALGDRILGGSLRGCFSPGVMTFDQFAESVLQTASVPMRPLSGLMKRRLVGRLVAERASAGRLPHFSPIAQTSGLVDLICNWISEMKRLEIWPDQFRKACESRGTTQKDIELLAIYEDYQRLLEEHDLYDAEGRFWRARDRLQKAHPRQVSRLKLVVADGFTDFTHTQHEILQLLGERVQRMLITLPLEEDSDRPDLFFKPLATLEELRRRHPTLEHRQIDRPQSTGWPAMAHLEANLFRNPRQVRPADETDGLEILAASRQLGEIEQIGRRIKLLLSEGCKSSGTGPIPPEQIAVVFRSTDGVSELIGEVFGKGKLGIPFSLESRPALESSKPLAALVALLRLDVEDWPFRELLALLGSNYFQPGWPDWQEGRAARQADRVIRRLQIPRGRKRLIEQLEKKGDDDGTAATVALLKRLDEVLSELPNRATLNQWAEAWERLAEQTGILQVSPLPLGEGPGVRAEANSDSGSKAPQVAQSTPTPPHPLPKGEGTTDAWEELKKALDHCDTLDNWLASDAELLDRREALAALLDILGSVPMRGGRDESGRVRVLSAQSARALNLPYLFFAGLSESAFPPPPSHDRLYSEAESQRLIEAGLPLVGRGQRNCEEMLLFYEVATRATRRLWMSYPAFDESASPLTASPYLQEVEQVCGPGQICRIESLDLSPVPPDDEPLTAAEFRVKALADAMSGNVLLLAGLLRHEPSPGVAQNILAGLRLTDQRSDRKHFGPTEGILPGESARSRLTEQYSDRHIFSATELEGYASCPYRFLFEKVLRLEPLEELVLDVDYLWRGWLVHEALAAFHRRVNQSHGGPVSPAELEPELYDRLVAETLEELSVHRSDNPVEAALREVDHRLLVGWMADYRAQHAAYDKFCKKSGSAMEPTLFEVSFGHDRELEPPSTGKPLECHTGEGTIHIRGRIDRVDVGSAGGSEVFNVVDYKTGRSIRPDAEAVLSGRALQLPLYALAVEKLLLADRGALPWQVGYWSVRENGFKPRKALQMYEQADDRLVPTAEWAGILARLPDTVGALVRGIRQGEFPVFSQDEHCTGYCPFNTVCRITHIRSLEKRWDPPRKTD